MYTTVYKTKEDALKAIYPFKEGSWVTIRSDTKHRFAGKSVKIFLWPTRSKEIIRLAAARNAEKWDAAAGFFIDPSDIVELQEKHEVQPTDPYSSLKW